MARVINSVSAALSFVAFVLNLTANCSSNWWVALKPQEFERIGLWEVCFNHYHHRFDYYGKIYTGCWWHFSPETRMLFSWVSTPWYRAVQAFATLSLIFMLFAFLAILMLLVDKKEKQGQQARHTFRAGFITLASACFMLIAVLTFGTRGKDRNWMPRWQQNWFGWSFEVAIVACILEFVVAGILLFDGANTKLVKIYVEKLYYEKQKRFPSAPK